MDDCFVKAKVRFCISAINKFVDVILPFPEGGRYHITEGYIYLVSKRLRSRAAERKTLRVFVIIHPKSSSKIRKLKIFFWFTTVLTK